MDDDVSKLSEPESHMQKSEFKQLLGLEPNSVQPLFKLMADAMKMPATMENLWSNDAWVCDTASNNHFTKSKNGA